LRKLYEVEEERKSEGFAEVGGGDGALIGGLVLIYLLICLFLAVYLWFNPIVF
jgi:hypothetical protein